MRIKLFTAALLCVFLSNAQDVKIVRHEQLLKGIESQCYNPVLSPDGQKVLFTQSDYEGLNVYDIADDVVTPLASDRLAGFSPAFSKDGKSVYFLSQTRENMLVYREMKTNAPVQRIALTSEQAKHFLQYIESSPQYCSWLPLFVTLLGTGMRASECTGLVWDDIDFENNCIHVDHALIYRSIHGNAKWYISTLKTRNSVRTIPMISAVAQQLNFLYEKHIGKHAKPGPTLDGYHDFVFLNRFGQLINAHGIDRAIERIRTSYNDVESTRAKEYDRKPELLPHFTAHCLRHTFCTRLCECEKDLAVIQHLMGHSDIETTLTVYDHVSPNRLRKAMNSLVQAYVFGLL